MKARTSSYVGVSSFLRSVKRLLKVAVKPTRKELSLSLKICFLGILLVGTIGFIILYIASSLLGFVPG
mgnify:CR=1 FL=1